MNIKKTKGKTVQFYLIFALIFSTMAPVFTPRAQAVEPQHEEIVLEDISSEQLFLDKEEEYPNSCKIVDTGNFTKLIECQND